MNVNHGKLKLENKNMILQSLLLEKVVRYLLLKPDLCGVNSNASRAEWIETHKCFLGEQKEEIQSIKVSRLHKLTSIFLYALLLC